MRMSRFAATVTSTLTLRPAEGIDRVVIGTGFGMTADTTGLTALNVDASVASNRLLIIGNDGANTLLATAFNDTVFGGEGDDQLSGLAGVDTLTGGAGADTFRDTSVGLNGDTITDFARGDRIVLTDATLGLTVGLIVGSSGSQLTYGSTSLFLSNVRNPSIAFSAAAEGGVQISSADRRSFSQARSFPTIRRGGRLPHKRDWLLRARSPANTSSTPSSALRNSRTRSSFKLLTTCS